MLLEALTPALQPLLGSHDFLCTFSDFIPGWQTFPLAIWRRPGWFSILQWAIAPCEAPSEGQTTLFLASSLSGQVWRGGLVSVFCRSLQLFWRRCLFKRMILPLRKEAFARFKISYCPVFRVGGERVVTVQWHGKTDAAIRTGVGRKDRERERDVGWRKPLCHAQVEMQVSFLRYWMVRAAKGLYGVVTLVDDLRPWSLEGVATKRGDMCTPLLSLPSWCFHRAMIQK